MRNTRLHQQHQQQQQNTLVMRVHFMGGSHRSVCSSKHPLQPSGQAALGRTGCCRVEALGGGMDKGHTYLVFPHRFDPSVPSTKSVYHTQAAVNARPDRFHLEGRTPRCKAAAHHNNNGSVLNAGPAHLTTRPRPPHPIPLRHASTSPKQAVDVFACGLRDMPYFGQLDDGESLAASEFLDGGLDLEVEVWPIDTEVVQALLEREKSVGVLSSAGCALL